MTPKTPVPSVDIQTSSFAAMMPAFSPLSLLRAVWKQKVLGSLVAILVSVVGIVVTFRLPAVYMADALILVDPQKIPEKFVTSTVNTDVQDRLATLSQEIQSSTRLKTLIDEFNLYPKERLTHSPEEIIRMMQKDIHIDLERGVGGNRPGAFRISYQGPDAAVVVRVVERITNFYIEENLRSRAVQAAGTFDFMDNQLRDAKTALAEQEAAVTRYKLQHNGELPQQESSLNATLTRLQVELQGNQEGLNRAQQNRIAQENSLRSAETLEGILNRQAQQVQKARANGEPVAAVAAAGEAPPPKARTAAEDLEAQIALLRARYSDAHPDIRRLQAMLASVKSREQQAPEGSRPRTAPGAVQSSPARQPAAARNDPAAARNDEDGRSDGLSFERAQAHERVANLSAQLEATRRELQDRAKEGDRILREIAVYQRRIEQLPVRDLEMAGLTRNFEFSKGYYNGLLNKKTEAEMATDLERRQKAETFRILDPPRQPTKPFKPGRTVLSAMSVVLGLALGLFSAVGWELKTGVLLGEWELPAGITVLSRVPTITPALNQFEDDEAITGKREAAAGSPRFPVLSSSGAGHV